MQKVALKNPRSVKDFNVFLLSFQLILLSQSSLNRLAPPKIRVVPINKRVDFR
jgi:hypothetical protein